MKPKVSKSKPIREIQSHKDYSGEASPHWDATIRNSQYTTDGGIVENVLANQDTLSEEDNLYYRPLTDAGQLQMSVIEELLPELTDQQQRILELRGFEGQTEETTAKLLGLKRRTVRTVLCRLRTRIKRAYHQRKLQQETGK